MSDKEILDCHNDVLRAQQFSVATYKHVAVEIPEGLPQVEYSENCDQWVPRGGVLRCLIHDDENRQPVIEIDDREFTIGVCRTLNLHKMTLPAILTHIAEIEASTFFVLSI